MRRSVSVVSILLAFLVSLAMGVSAASAKSCIDRLEQGNGLYLCSGVDEFGNEVDFGLAILGIGGSGPDFAAELFSNTQEAILVCACKSKAKKSGDKFEFKKSFQCSTAEAIGSQSTPFDFDDGAYEGTVGKKGRTIGNGQGVDEEGGVSISYKCEEFIP
jgi:hypothetical protein